MEEDIRLRLLASIFVRGWRKVIYLRYRRLFLVNEGRGFRTFRFGVGVSGVLVSSYLSVIISLKRLFEDFSLKV